MKGMSVKRLPQILAIQLKRFGYDWENNAATKFNDYFEFPRNLDMTPYTALGLAQAKGWRFFLTYNLSTLSYCIYSIYLFQYRNIHYNIN